MDNLEKLATLGKQDTGRKTKTHHRKPKRWATWTPSPKKTPGSHEIFEKSDGITVLFIN